MAKILNDRSIKILKGNVGNKNSLWWEILGEIARENLKGEEVSEESKEIYLKMIINVEHHYRPRTLGHQYIVVQNEQ